MAISSIQTPLLVRGARQLLTMRGPGGPRRGEAMQELGLIPDGAVLIRAGNIVSLGPSRRVENLSMARQAREIDATGRVVAPGFVDSHTHLVCGPARLMDYEMRLAGSSYREIAEAGGGILASVRAVREMPIRRLILQARQTLAGCVAHGTTTLEAKSGYGLSLDAELMGIEAVGEESLASVKFSGQIKESEHGPAEPFVEVWNLSRPTSGKTGWVLAGIQQIS
jgi:imidazolonepropionase